MDNQFDLIENISKLNRMLRRKPGGERQHSHARHKALGILLENDGIRAADLAEEMDIRPSSLTDVLKRLEEHEYIYKVKDENDSRAIKIHATEKAKQEFVHRKQQNEQAEWIKSCLTQEEIESFCLTCGKLISFLESEYPESSADKDLHGRHHRHHEDRHYEDRHHEERHHEDRHYEDNHHEERHHRGEEGKEYRNKRGRV